MNREELKDYRNNQEWIKERIEYIANYKDSINKLITTISDMPKGSKNVEDSMAEKLAKLMDAVNELIDKIIEKDKKQKEILIQLDRIEQPYRIILDKVYIQGKTLVTVASEMIYDYKYVCKQHGIALNKFDNTTKEVETRH